MRRTTFRPGRFQTTLLAIIGICAIGFALYTRYRVIEVSAIGLACDAGMQSWTCELRRTATAMFNNSVFGYTSIVAAVLNLVHPSIVLLALGLFAGGLGVVLYNVALSALALALLIISLARPEPEPD
jgi:hypothetical protein